MLGLGAIVGVRITGRLSDRMIDRRQIIARPTQNQTTLLFTSCLAGWLARGCLQMGRFG